MKHEQHLSALTANKKVTVCAWPVDCIHVHATKSPITFGHQWTTRSPVWLTVKHRAASLWWANSSLWCLAKKERFTSLQTQNINRGILLLKCFHGCAKPSKLILYKICTTNNERYRCTCSGGSTLGNLFNTKFSYKSLWRENFFIYGNILNTRTLTKVVIGMQRHCKRARSAPAYRNLQ